MTYHVFETCGKTRLIRDARIQSIKKLPGKDGDIFLIHVRGEVGTVIARDVQMVGPDGTLKSIVKEAPKSPVDQFLQRLVVKSPGKPPAIFQVKVPHNDGCPKLTGGECNCDPELEITVRHVAPAGQGES